MRSKYIAGILLAACFGAVLAAAHGGIREPTVYNNPAIIVGGCYTYQSGMWVVPLGGNGSPCTSTGVPLHGVPMPNAGRVRTLRVTGNDISDAPEGSVITVYVNGNPTALSCTVGATGKCQDLGHSVGVRAGDELGATATVPGYGSVTLSLEVCLSDAGNGC